MNSEIVDMTAGICGVCRKNPVSRWCDFIIKYDNHLTFFRDRGMFNESNQHNADYQTCDLPMCEDCAINVSRETDMCPHHNNLLNQVDLPNVHQRKRQGQEKGRIASELLKGAKT